MTTDLNPTHRTNRAIGKIKAGSPIRFARYLFRGDFSDILLHLGETAYHIDYRYCGDDAQFWDPRAEEATRRYVLPGNYIITDGEHFEVSETDSGLSLLPHGRSAARRMLGSPSMKPITVFKVWSRVLFFA